MTIYTINIYSPISGYITGRDNYCLAGDTNVNCLGTGAVHYGCNSGSSRVDIEGSGALYLRATNVKSFIPRIGYYCCSSTGCANDYKRTIKIELYGKQNAVCYIGAVLFGHVTSPTVSDGVIYNLTTTAYQIGSVTTGSCSGCSSGAHSHMERFGGSVVAPCCGTSVSSSTPIYRFTWDDTISCPI